MFLPTLLSAVLTLNAGVTTDGAPDFLAQIDARTQFDAIAVEATSPYAARVTKYLLPAREDPELLATLFQNVNLHRFHYDFLVAVFPDRFAGLTFDDYLDLVMRRVSRDYYAGTITHYFGPTGQTFGFTVLADGADPGELLTPEEVKYVYEQLGESFKLEPLEYAPQRTAAILEARSWVDPGFPIRDRGDQELPDAIGYHPATNYGVMRRYTLAQLTAAEGAGELDRQTIVVVDDVPEDIETAIAGLVTGVPQGELSHLGIRLARRDVPNVFVDDAMTRFADVDGTLVRFEVTVDGYDVRAATLEEAEAWWSEHRPSLPPIPAVDEEYAAFDRITDIDLASGAAGALKLFGGKAAGLAALYEHLPPQYQTPGFAIPFRYYLEFIRTNTIPSLTNPAVEVSYEAYIDELLADTRFRTDGAYRRTTLEGLRDHMRAHGVVPASLLDALRDRIVEVFADPQVKVRFRSSSNGEDSPEFTGAGLYDSTSVCLPDELDDDNTGPSLCDTSKQNERTIERALKKVWASLWNYRAYEEREYFQIDHRRAAMGLVVTLAYPAEDSNGVAFTGDPANRESPHYVINVQLGDESVVRPGVGIESEKDVLVMDGSSVRKVVRARASSLTVPDQYVLSEEQLDELGGVLASVRDGYLSHYDFGAHPPGDVLVDFEFKFQDGQLIVKQARPFLVSDPAPPGPVFAIDLDPDLSMCALFQDDRSAYDEYRFKSRIELAEGRIELPARSVYVVADFIDRLEFGPEQQVLEPLGSGLFEVSVRASCCPEGLTYTWDYTQDFDLDGEPLRVSLFRSFRVIAGTPDEFEWNVDSVALRGTRLFAPGITYAPCEFDHLPLWEMSAELEGGDRVRFLKRFEEPVAGSGPVSLPFGEAQLGGVTYSETSYWRLVYAADHHNFNEKFVQVFDTPITVGETTGVAALFLLEEFRGSPPAAALLDANFNVLRELDVISYSEELAPPRFIRGDCNDDGAVDISDGIFHLNALFVPGTDEPTCLEACDTNDDDSGDISDAIFTFNFLFVAGSEVPAAPHPLCGLDPEPEASLGCGGVACD